MGRPGYSNIDAASGKPNPNAPTAVTIDPRQYYDMLARSQEQMGKPVAPEFDNGLISGGNVLDDRLRSSWVFDPMQTNWSYDTAKNQLADPYNKQYMNSLWDYSQSTSDSPWLTVALQKQQQDEANLLDQSRQQAEGALAQSRSQMAMRGGLENGASERLARQNMLDRMNLSQNIRSQGASNRLGLQQQEMQNKLQTSQMLPGWEQGRANLAAQVGQFNLGQNLDAAKMDLANQQFNSGQRMQNAQTGLANQQYNINNTLSSIRERELAKLNKYHEQMAAWAAEKTGNATAGGGGGFLGCFITTAVCEFLGFADDCYILKQFRKFRDEVMKPDPLMAPYVEEYYQIAPKLVEKIKDEENSGIVWLKVLRYYLIPALEHIEKEEYAMAFIKYRELVEELKSKYEV